MTEQSVKTEQPSKVTTDFVAFGIVASIVTAIILCCLIFREPSLALSKSIYHFVINYADWIYQYGAGTCLILMLWLAFGKYGNIKMGTAEDKVEFSDWSYRGMIFTCGVGANLIYWAIGEPLYYLSAPPFGAEMGAEAGSLAATKYAIVYPMWHWGITMWAVYCVPCIALGYALCVRRSNVLRFGNCLKPIIGKHADGWGGTLVNIMVTFALVIAFGTGFGLLVPLMGKILHIAIGVPDTKFTLIMILLAFVALTAICLYAGLDKGIKRLSDFTVFATLGLTAFVLVAGPTDFILDYSLDSLGVMFQEFIRMQTWLDPVNKSGHPQNWDVFYWAWAFAMIGLCGPFVARISRGRSLKNIILSMLIFGTLGVSIVMLIFGSYAVHLQFFGGVDLLAVKAQQGIEMAMVTMFKSLPGGSFLLIIWCLTQWFLMGTTVNGACYNCALMTSKGVTPYNSPSKHNQMFWAIMLVAMGIASIFMGDLKAVKNWVIPTGIMGFILTFSLFYCLIKWIREDVGDSLDPPKPFAVTPKRNGI
jgi:choline-glycine betaine transporter